MPAWVPFFEIMLHAMSVSLLYNWECNRMTFIKDNWTYLASLSAGVAVAVGWAVTYVGWRKAHENNMNLEKFKFDASLKVEQKKLIDSLNLDKTRAELKFVSDQIQFLYGPLFAAGRASGIAFSSFMHRYAPNRDAYFDGAKRTQEELQIWRLWMIEVMMPLNLAMERAIIQNGHLMVGASMPRSFQDLLSHVASYKAVLRVWEDAKRDGTLADLTEEDHVSVINYPVQFERDVAFDALRARQRKLITMTQRTNRRPGG
jgi:hypothetical protein